MPFDQRAEGFFVAACGKAFQQLAVCKSFGSQVTNVLRQRAG
jgi:hypothetical protein